jgi:ATP/maltotriose-dependent transcriptional regulator MalT
MRARVMLALALFGQRQINQARQVMAEAVRLAEADGFSRPFLEFGVQTYPLLKLLLHSGKLSSGAQSFIKELLRILDDKSDGSLILPVNELADLSMAASITNRELEVLRLLGGGQSNLEIANSLCISVSTVSSHLGSIYSKLGVNNRVQAATRARELDMI